MELITKRVHTMRTKCEAVSQVTFDEDLNVPDVKPDVGRMIQKKGEIQIDEMQVSDGHVFFNGALLVALMYVSGTKDPKSARHTADCRNHAFGRFAKWAESKT